MYPTDGYVNGRRSNYPLGEVKYLLNLIFYLFDKKVTSDVRYESSNKSKLGQCKNTASNSSVR